jgi:hypothetical protein
VPTFRGRIVCSQQLNLVEPAQSAKFGYGQFCVAPAHQLGFNDLKAIEVAGYLDAIAGRRAEPFNFRGGLRIQTLVETIQESSRAGAWKEVV